MTRIPPYLDGHGGSQRAWRLVEALRDLGNVHYVLVSRKSDHDAATVSLKPLEPLVASVTHIDIPEWEQERDKRFGILAPGWFDLLGMRSAEAPYISRPGLEQIVAQLPIRAPDVLFAGRLPVAVMMQGALDAGLISAHSKVVDFDDIMSRFRHVQLSAARKELGVQGGILARIDLRLIQQAERRIASTWDAVSVCTDEDVRLLGQLFGTRRAVKVPNVVDRTYLRPPSPSKDVRILFVGNLSFGPNVAGLFAFAREAWPLVREAVPNAKVTVVGINPNPDVRELARQSGFELHADVPTVMPYYEESDLVIAPIFFGSGTRIKILEAMAYGRAVVSTPLGAAGLDVTHGHDILLAGAMPEFAAQTIALAKDPERRRTIAENARSLQQSKYSPQALTGAIHSMVAPIRELVHA